jgi:hypothetical protein
MHAALKLSFRLDDQQRGDNPVLRRHEHKFLELVQETWDLREAVHRPPEHMFRLVIDLRKNYFFNNGMSPYDIDCLHNYVSQGFGDEPGEILPI